MNESQILPAIIWNLGDGKSLLGSFTRRVVAPLEIRFYRPHSLAFRHFAELEPISPFDLYEGDMIED